MAYRTRSIFCEAYCWHSTTPRSNWPGWLEAAVTATSLKLTGRVTVLHDRLILSTIHGVATVENGDWIVYWSSLGHQIEVFLSEDFVRRFERVPGAPQPASAESDPVRFGLRSMISSRHLTDSV